MEFILTVVDIVLHVDRYLGTIILDYGVWSYAIIFAIIFAETGFVVTPFLPGDSLLFAVGAFAAIGSFDPWLITVVIAVAAILGDTVNYWAGFFTGPKVFHGSGSRVFKEGIPGPHPRVLREARREDHLSGAFRADHPHLRSLCGGDR